MSNLRRYEILLPLKFNDGQPVPWALIGDTLVELRRRFGAVTWDTQIVRGVWQHQETEFHDDLVRVLIDVPDRAENRQFFATLKEQLKARFRQHEIWMTTHLIEVI